MSNEDLISKWVLNITVKEDFIKDLSAWKKLRIKFWIDPTWEIIHLWHAVPLLKLREFQQLWHQIVLIIWDSTAQVWDTSDKTAERPMLSREETRNNAKNWLNKISKIIDINKTEIHFNSEWMDKTNFNDVWELAKLFSVTEILDRDNFSKRFNEWKRISLQEFLYPLMQWFDSLQINSDVEIWWNDQLFNLLAWRKIQEWFWQKKQNIITLKLLLWPDWQKMSKTSNNCIPIDMDGINMFIKIMEIKDELILDYFELATIMNKNDIAFIKEKLVEWINPKEIKLLLAFNIVEFYHSTGIAEKAKEFFINSISNNWIPNIEDIPHINFNTILDKKLIKFLKEFNFFKTTWETKSSIESWWIKINWNIINDIYFEVWKEQLIQIWKKRFIFIK